MGMLAHFFLDTDMRCSHIGFKKLLVKHKIKIKEGEFVVFMNSARTIVKMFCGGTDAILHVKNEGRVLDPGVIPYLPKYCGGKKLDLDGAVKEHLEELMKNRKPSS